MDDRQTRKKRMARAVKKVMDNNSVIWNGTPAIVSKHAALGGSIGRLNNYQLIQNTDISGFAALKKANKKGMAKRALDVAKPTTAFARDMGKTVLLEEVDFELTDITKAKDSDALEFCRLIHDRGTTYLPEMGDYPISSDTLGDLDDANTLFDVSIPSPKAAKSEISAVTKVIEIEFDVLDEIFLGMDELMVPFKTTATEFYFSYESARKIDNTGIRHISARGKITDAGDGALITKVKVTAIAADGTTQQVVSSSLGLYRIFSMETGSYVFTFEHAGYEKLVVEHVVIEPEGITELDVQMVKE